MGSIALPITVLLVDPNKEDREYWVQRLTISSQAFSVLEADNGAAELGICQSQRIDCVVVEVTLPDMSGFQFLSRVIPRALRPQIPVILFSRLNLPPMRRLAMNNGARTYLVKSDVAGHELGWEIHKAIAAVARRKGHYATTETSAQQS